MTRKLWLSLIVVGAAAPMSARAQNGERLAAAAQFAGFDLLGNRNPLSGGIDFLATNQFDPSTPFNFGAWNVALSGPVSLDVSTGGRLLSQFDVSFSTAATGNAAAVPLEYAYTIDTGPQTIQINGSVLADVDFSLNRLGYYDLKVTASGRQTRTTDGVVTGTNDFDTGPITLSGNIYLDSLAVLTDPLFDQAGRPNLFLQLGGNDALAAMLSDPAAETDAKRVVEAAYRVIVPPGLASGHGNGPPGGFPPGRGDAWNAAAVPEPAVLVLMLVAAPVILFRSRFTR